MTYKELLESLATLTLEELALEVEVSISFEKEKYGLLAVTRNSEGDIALKIDY